MHRGRFLEPRRPEPAQGWAHRILAVDLTIGLGNAGCDLTGGSISILNLFDPSGAQYCLISILGGGFQPCPSQFLFGVGCIYYIGDLTLAFGGVAPTGQVTPMKMGEYLGQLGFNTLTQIKGSLSLVVNTTNSVSTAPFLPNLTSVLGDVKFQEFNVIRQQPIIFSQIPLQSVKVIGGSLSSYISGLTDMSGFAGLRCIGRALILAINLLLGSLSGLEGLAVIDPNNLANTTFPAIFMANNLFLTAPNKFAALSLAAGCSRVSPPNSINITVSNPSQNCPFCDCPQQITSFGQLCAYIAGASACPT